MVVPDVYFSYTKRRQIPDYPLWVSRAATRQLCQEYILFTSEIAQNQAGLALLKHLPE